MRHVRKPCWPVCATTVEFATCLHHLRCAHHGTRMVLFIDLQAGPKGRIRDCGRVTTRDFSSGEVVAPDPGIDENMRMDED